MGSFFSTQTNTQRGGMIPNSPSEINTMVALNMSIPDLVRYMNTNQYARQIVKGVFKVYAMTPVTKLIDRLGIGGTLDLLNVGITIAKNSTLIDDQLQRQWELKRVEVENILADTATTELITQLGPRRTFEISRQRFESACRSKHLDLVSKWWLKIFDVWDYTLNDLSEEEFLLYMDDFDEFYIRAWKDIIPNNLTIDEWNKSIEKAVRRDPAAESVYHDLRFRLRPVMEHIEYEIQERPEDEYRLIKIGERISDYNDYPWDFSV